MTFTATATGGHPTIFVQAWGGADLTAPFDQQNGNTAASGTTYQPGSVTPGSANELIVSLLFGAGSGTTTIDSSFTISDQLASTANAMAGGMAYLIQTSAAAVNPTWTRGGIGNVGPASIATFKIPVTAIFLPQRLAFNQAVNRAATY